MSFSRNRIPFDGQVSRTPWRRTAIDDDRIDLPAGIAYNAIIDITQAPVMASITIRNLDERTKSRLRVRAAHHSRSMEDEARTILRNALAEKPTDSPDLASAVRARFQPLGGVELRLPAREPMREPPTPAK